MTKIKVFHGIPKKDFEKHYGRYAYGNTGKTNGHVIHLKEGLRKKFSKKALKEFMEHEVGHIFSDTSRVNKKLSVTEKRRLLHKDSKFKNNHYKRLGATSSKARMEEIIADIYVIMKRKNRDRERLRKKYPKTYETFKKEMRKFKPKLMREKW